MAENAGNAADKASWLRLAASWLGMIKGEPRRFFAARNDNAPENESVGSPFWRTSGGKDSETAQ